MAIDIFSIREMSEPLNLQFAPKTFLQRLFVKRAVTHETRSFNIDKVTGGRRMSVFSSPLSQGVVVRAAGFTTMDITPGYIKELSALTPGDLQNRMPGEEIFGNHRNLAERSAEEIGARLAEMNNAVTRREEYMTSTALTTGKVIVSEMDDAGSVVSSREIDFGMNANHLYTIGGTKWDNAGADILGDLKTISELVAKNSGHFPNVAILGSSAASGILLNTAIKGWLDTQYANVAEMRLALDTDGGVTRVGVLRAPGLTMELHAYHEWYKDPATGTVTELMPAKKVLVGNTNARVEMHYRPIEDFGIGLEFPEVAGANMVRLRRFAKSWETQNPSARHLLVQSGPCPVPVEIDAFGCIQVLT